MLAFMSSPCREHEQTIRRAQLRAVGEAQRNGTNHAVVDVLCPGCGITVTRSCTFTPSD